MGWVCRPATPKPSASEPSPPPVSASVSRPRPWTGVRGAQPRRPPRPGNSHRPSCMSGSAARSSTPSWAPRWWSSCTAKATPPSPPPRAWAHHTAGPTAATGWPANASARPPPGQLSRLHQPLPATQEREMLAGYPLTLPARQAGRRAAVWRLLSSFGVPGSWLKAPLGYESWRPCRCLTSSVSALSIWLLPLPNG
jgi:hypothetical protein